MSFEAMPGSSDNFLYPVETGAADFESLDAALESAKEKAAEDPEAALDQLGSVLQEKHGLSKEEARAKAEFFLKD